MKPDIQNKNDIQLLVDRFYGKVKNDDLLSPVFASRIADNDWPAHLQRMYQFWDAILFAQTGFQGNPMRKHLSLPINQIHFERWLYLFEETLNELFAGEKANEALKRATSIAHIMNFKISSLAEKR